MKCIEEFNDNFSIYVSEEHDDGSATLTVEYNKEFRAALREIYKRQRCTKKLVKKFVMDGIDNAIQTHTKGESNGE